MVEGSDIVSATQNLAGTHLANIEPNRNQKTNPSENLEAGSKGKKNHVWKLLLEYLSITFGSGRLLAR